jgi:hypothetical protein
VAAVARVVQRPIGGFVRILIARIDGYLGWSPSPSTCARGGHAIAGMDNGAGRRWVAEMGSFSAVPVASPA